MASSMPSVLLFETVLPEIVPLVEVLTRMP